MPTVSDDFNRANGAIGANWTNLTNTWTVASNAAKPGTAAAFNMSRYTGAGAFANDQRAYANVTPAGGSYPGVAVRCDGSSNGYCFMSANNSGWRIARIDAGANNDLQTGADAISAGDVIECRAVGTTISGWINGVQVVSLTDSTYTSGLPGMWSYEADGTFDNFNATDSFGAAAEVEQEGFRWRDDDGSEPAATWLATQDSDITRVTGQNTRLRLLLNGTNDPASTQFQLEYKLSTDSVYAAVPVFVSPSVTYGDAGTASAGTTSVTPAYPTGISASTSKLFCIVTGRSSTADTAPTMPAGWTSVLDFEGGTGTFGTDTGTRRVTIFQKDVTTGSETGTETVSLAGSGTNTLRAIIFRFEVPAGHSIAVQASTGADTSDDTSYSATGSTALDLTANDLLMTVTAQNLDTGTQTSQTITATGVTLGTRTNRATAPVTAGADHRQIIETIPVSSGTASVAPTYSYTVSAAASGPTGFLRMRSTPPPIHLSLSSNIAASGEATTAQLTAPSGKTTGDFVAGRIQDDENPADAVDITADDYTELEWCLVASAAATNGQVYQFRVTVGGTPLDTYTVTPQLTIGAPGGATGRGRLVSGKLVGGNLLVRAA